MDVKSASSAELYLDKRVVFVQMIVSEIATSSYIRFLNRSGERLSLSVEMVEGVPRTADPGASRAAVGTHYIDPGPENHFTVAFHIPYGGGAAQNMWRTNFTLVPATAGSSIESRTFRIALVNAPGRSSTTSGDNFVTVQVL